MVSKRPGLFVPLTPGEGGEGGPQTVGENVGDGSLVGQATPERGNAALQGEIEHLFDDPVGAPEEDVAGKPIDGGASGTPQTPGDGHVPAVVSGLVLGSPCHLVRIPPSPPSARGDLRQGHRQIRRHRASVPFLPMAAECPPQRQRRDREVCSLPQQREQQSRVPATAERTGEGLRWQRSNRAPQVLDHRLLGATAGTRIVPGPGPFVADLASAVVRAMLEDAERSEPAHLEERGAVPERCREEEDRSPGCPVDRQLPAARLNQRIDARGEVRRVALFQVVDRGDAGDAAMQIRPVTFEHQPAAASSVAASRHEVTRDEHSGAASLQAKPRVSRCFQEIGGRSSKRIDVSS